MEVTVELLSRAIDDATRRNGTKVFLIDGECQQLCQTTDATCNLYDSGFPRKMDQLELFERAVCRASSALFLDCPNVVRLPRLLDRGKGKNVGHSDDNAETIQKRFNTFTNTSMAVAQSLEHDNRFVRTDAQQRPEEVSTRMENAVKILVTLKLRD